MLELKYIKWFLTVVAIVLMTACGGGSGGESGDGDNPTVKEIAISHITEYAQNSGIAPTLQDYLDAGVTGVTEANLAEINEVVENLTQEDVDTTEEIQALVDELGIVLPPDTIPPVAITHNGTTYYTVTSPYTGKVWLDRNLGATQVCIAFNDSFCYGDYYQWGRNFDGHEDSMSGVIDINATQIDPVQVAVSGKFITNSGSPFDWTEPLLDDNGDLRQVNWLKTDGSSVCPIGFRVPNIDELKTELIYTGSAEAQNINDAYNSFLKLPSAGYRNWRDGIDYQGLACVVWSSSVDGFYSPRLTFDSSGVDWSNAIRASGISIRCLKD